MSKETKIQIRNSTAEFLVFTSQAGEKGIEVRVEDETVWLTQKLIGALFEVDVRTVSEHFGNIFASGELDETTVIRKFRNTACDGKSYLTAFYNLDAIITVGFRVNSVRAAQFRQWAIGILRDFAQSLRRIGVREIPHRARPPFRIRLRPHDKAATQERQNGMSSIIATDLAPAPWASEKEWHPKQKMIRRKGGALELHIPVADTRDIESWILSLGEHVRVLGQEGLSKAIMSRYSRALKGCRHKIS